MLCTNIELGTIIIRANLDEFWKLFSPPGKPPLLAGKGPPGRPEPSPPEARPPPPRRRDGLKTGVDGLPGAWRAMGRYRVRGGNPGKAELGGSGRSWRGVPPDRAGSEPSHRRPRPRRSVSLPPPTLPTALLPRSTAPASGLCSTPPPLERIFIGPSGTDGPWCVE